MPNLEKVKAHWRVMNVSHIELEYHALGMFGLGCCPKCERMLIPIASNGHMIVI